MIADIEQQQVKHVGEGMGDSSDLTAKSSHTKTSAKSSKTHLSLPVDESVIELVESHNAGKLDDNDDPNQRKTQLYCGFCCDVLTASFVVDCLYVPWMISSVFFNLGLLEDAKDLNLLEDTDDDGNNDSSGLNPFVLLAMKNGLGAVFGLVGIIGTWKMYKWLVLTTGIWFCVDLVWSCVFKRYVMISLIFNIYPHFALFEALWSGKITRENFKSRERRCCCCNDTDK